MMDEIKPRFDEPCNIMEVLHHSSALRAKLAEIEEGRDWHEVVNPMDHPELTDLIDRWLWEVMFGFDYYQVHDYEAPQDLFEGLKRYMASRTHSYLISELDLVQWLPFICAEITGDFVCRSAGLIRIEALWETVNCTAGKINGVVNRVVENADFVGLVERQGGRVRADYLHFNIGREQWDALDKGESVGGLDLLFPEYLLDRLERVDFLMANCEGGPDPLRCQVVSGIAGGDGISECVIEAFVTVGRDTFSDIWTTFFDRRHAVRAGKRDRAWADMRGGGELLQEPVVCLDDIEQTPDQRRFLEADILEQITAALVTLKSIPRGKGEGLIRNVEEFFSALGIGSEHWVGGLARCEDHGWVSIEDDNFTIRSNLVEEHSPHLHQGALEWARHFNVRKF